ncbi:MFS transporter [Amycolatopsis sp. NPDC059021]|uniref:MFS transporter n=1 Tax=Amycolatopsis sp. NPDC059021 TaxID=3346704 RepID=UPI00366F3979
MRKEGRGHFTAALASAEFRAMWLAEALSQIGDQLARVALALLVFGRTNSALLTALTYALTFLPSLLGGLLLSGLGDRFPRRTVIVVTDVLRGCLAAAMAIPGLPLTVLWCLVGVLTLAGSPFKAAQMALLPDVLPEGRYQAGLGLRQVTMQTAQLAGFGLGGLLVTAIGPSWALLLNGGTFFVSALLVITGVHARPASRRDRASSGGEANVVRGRDPRIAIPFAVNCLLGLIVVPEGLAAPYAHEAGASVVMVGVLMMADPVGSVFGGWWAGRSSPPPTTRSAIVPMALAGLPLAGCAVTPGYVWPIVWWGLSGALATIALIRGQTVIVAVVPDARRATVLGRLNACLYTTQGIALVAAGAVADQLGPRGAVAASGALTTVLAIGAALVWRETRPEKRAAGGEARSAGPDRSVLTIAHDDSSPGSTRDGHPGAGA